jgi:hypothetical protein
MVAGLQVWGVTHAGIRSTLLHLALKQCISWAMGPSFQKCDKKTYGVVVFLGCKYSEKETYQYSMCSWGVDVLYKAKHCLIGTQNGLWR